jgi:hypothetical protein
MVGFDAFHLVVVARSVHLFRNHNLTGRHIQP